MAVSYDNINPCENFHISSDLNDEETCQAHEFMLFSGGRGVGQRLSV